MKQKIIPFNGAAELTLGLFRIAIDLQISRLPIGAYRNAQLPAWRFGPLNVNLWSKRPYPPNRNDERLVAVNPARYRMASGKWPRPQFGGLTYRYKPVKELATEEPTTSTRDNARISLCL